MAQFDVFPTPDPTNPPDQPFVVVLQHDHLADLASVIVAPLMRAQARMPIARLMPTVTIDGEEFVIVAPDMGAVSRRLLKEPVANLAAYRDDIVQALDRLFTGL